MPKKLKEQQVIVTMPDTGLTKQQLTTLKNRFKNEVVESMGGADKLASLGRTIIIIIIFC
jgi:primosomal protein N'